MSTLKINGAIQVGRLSADPSSPANGFIYYNTTTNTFKLYENGAFTEFSTAAELSAVTGAALIGFDDTGALNITAATAQAAIDDLDTAIGALDATPTNYTPVDPAVVASHLEGIDAALASAGGDTFLDNVFRIQDSVTPTKQIAFEATNITAANTRTITMPDTDVNLGDLASQAQDIADLVTLSGVAANSTDLGTFTGTTIPDASDVKEALQALETSVETKASSTDLSNHINDATDAHDASAISNVPAGNLAATDIQSAVNELQSDIDTRALDSAVIKKDGSVAFTAAQSMGGFKLTSVGAPTVASDAATKDYVDANIEGLKPKEAVRAATTVAGTLATSFENGDAIDGVTLATGDRILIKDQAAPAENGIYVVAASGAPTRATDFDSLSPIDEINGSMIPVQEGTANAGKIYVQQGVVATIGTDPINFVFFNSSSALVGGDGITVSGSNISVDHDGEGLTFVANQLALELDGATLAKSASGLKIPTAGVTDNEVATGIDAAKLADGSVSNAEFQFINSLTSNAQTQLNAKLENVVEDTTPQLGGDLDMNTFALEGTLKRGVVGATTGLVEEDYVDAITLASAQTNTVITELTFAHASYEGMEVTYKVKEATSNDIMIGKLWIVTNGTAVVINDTSTETAPTGISFDAVVNGANINVRYSSGANGASMRADVKKVRAG